MRYHWTFVLSFLIALILADFVTPAVHWDEMLVKHTWNAVPENWGSLGNTTAGATIDLHIALKPDRERALADALSEVSNPRHPRYGAYLSKEQVADLVSPPADTVDLVRAWLIHHDIRSSSISATHGGSWLTVTDVLVSQANQLLGASYQLYRNSKTNDTIICTVAYSVLVASGMDGVGAGECVNTQGNVRFIPEFPSSCPYVTSVGGTVKALPERAANLSGGGFSDYFERDDYQDLSVSQYLRRFPDNGLYNRDGRGYPDISAQALDYQYIKNGEMHFMNGTACAVSTVAGMVSLLNDFLLYNNKHALGFLNPLLYFMSINDFEGINDIKIGGNPGCGTGGFQATSGWDPVTGVGTIDFQKMLIAVNAWVVDQVVPEEDPSSDDDRGE